MCEQFRWAIIKASVWGNGQVGYHLVPGRKYKTERGAKKAFEKMSKQWDEKAERGLINPTWYGKFEEYGHKLIEIPEGQTLRQAVDNLEPGRIYYFGAAA